MRDARSSSVSQSVHPDRSRFLDGDVAHPEQGLVDLLGVLGLRPRLLAHALDGVGVESAERVGRTRIEPSPGDDGLGASLLERGVIEKGVRHRVEDAPREWRWFGGVDGDLANGAVPQPVENLEKPVDIHRLGEAVLESLAHHGLFPRDREVTGGQGLAAGQNLGEGPDEQILGPHPY